MVIFIVIRNTYVVQYKKKKLISDTFASKTSIIQNYKYQYNLFHHLFQMYETDSKDIQNKLQKFTVFAVFTNKHCKVLW